MIRPKPMACVFSILGAVLFLTAIPAFADSGSGRFSIRIYGAPAYLSGGDLNKGMEGLTGYVADMEKWDGLDVPGSYSAARFGLEFGVDVIFQITPNLGVGLGLGYLGASKTNSLDLIDPDYTAFQGEIFAKPEYSAVPLRLGVYYTLALSSKIDLSLNAGVGYYFAKAAGEIRFGSIAAPERWTFDMTGNGLGFHLGAALEYRISPTFGICIELAGRLAGISPFKGSGPFITDFPEGTLYNLDIVAGPLSQKYPLLLVAPPESMVGVADSSQAEVDFSGASLRIGVVIHL